MGKDIFSKKSRFSIRKLNIGVCSVLLGTLIMIGHTAQADETTSDGATVAATAVSASQGEGVAATTSPTTAPESVSTTTVTPAATETVAATPIAPTTSVAPSAAVSSEAPASTSVASSAPANSVATSTSPVVASEVTGSTNASTAKPATASEASRSVTASTTPSTTASSESAITNNISASETANAPRVRSRRSIAQGATRSASTATRASDGAQNLDYSNKENAQDYVQISYEVDKLNNVLHWTVLDNPGRKANSASGYVYFTIPKDSVGAPTNWQVVQTDKNGKVVNTRNYWKDNDGSYLMGQNGRMDTYTGSEMTQRLTQLYKDIKNPAIQGNEAAVAAQTAERSQALYTMTADNNAIRNVMWTITFDTPIVDKSKPLDYVAGMQGTGVIGGRTNIMTGYADNFIDNESSKFQAVAVKEKYTAKVGGSFDATPANYVTNKAGTPEFPNNYRGATTFAWKDGQAPTATQAGTYTKTVVVTYPAHYNQAPQEVTITFEVQGETPKPVAPASQVPEITSNLNGKASTPADVTVNATAGSTVKLYNNDGVVIGEAVANDQGVATVHPTNSLPEGEITATSTPAGGSESAKSAPITVTKTQLTYVGGGVSGDNYTQLLVTESHLTVYPGDPVNVTIQAAGSPSVEKFWIPNNPYLAKGLAYTNDSNGGFLDTAGSNTYRQRKAYYRGNVDMTQSAGSSTATYAVRNKNGKVVTRNLTITVLETAKKYEPTPGGAKVEVADPNNISATEKAAVEKAVGDANTALPQGTTYVADEKGNVTITYPDKSVDKIAAAYLVTPAKDTTAPDKPVVNTDLTGKAGTKTPVEVTAEKGSTVALYDKDNNKIGEATAGENGKATITPTVDIPAGNVTAKATDAAGNTSVASDPKVATDTTAPAKPVVNTDLTGKAGTKPSVEVSAEPGSTVALYDKDGNKIGEGTAASNGKVTITPTVDIPVGNVTAKATDPSGNTSDASDPKVATDTTAPAKPVVATDLTGKAGTKTPVEVSAEPGSTVALYDKDGNKIGEGTAASNGKVTITPTVDIPAGNVTAKATDPSGNTSDASDPKVATDTTAPAKPVVATDLTGKAGTKTPVEVSAEPGSTVALYDKDGNKIGEATAGADGKATVTPTVDIPAGNVTATATDASGNTSDASDPKVATDTTAPAKPVVNTDLTGKAGTKPSVEVSAEPGSTVALYDKDGNKIGEATAGADGKATITPTVDIPEGNVTATATDPSGNTSDPSAPAKATTGADTEAPAKPVVATDLTGKAGTKTPVEVSAEPGSTVALYDKDGNKIGEATAGADGKATITPTVDIPAGNVTATATDVAGNTSVASDPVEATRLRTDADKNDPTAKAQTVTPGSTPNAQDSIGNVADLPSGTTYDFKTPVDTATDGEKDATVVVTYPDGSKDEVPVKVTVKTPSTDADKNDPTAKAQTVTPGSTPNAQDSIGNVADLPSGTTYDFKTPVDTATDGEKDATVVVTYPDGSKDEVPVKVTVKTPSTDADKNDPTAKAQTVTPGSTPNAQDSIGNVADLPSGTTYDFKTPVDTATDGEKDATVVVTYPDGSKDEVPVKVTVKTPSTDADNNTPVAKAQTVTPGTTPNAQDSIGNVGDLPNGTKFDFKTPVDTATEGEKDATVVVTYPDGSKDEVPVKVTVKTPSTDADNNTPVAKAQTVTPGTTPNAQDSIGNVGDLPNGTKFDFKTPVDTATEGEKDATVVVTYPDGSKDEVPVKVTVKTPSTDADNNTPVAKAQTVTPGTTPNAQDSIGNVADLPSGTTYDFKTPVDTTTEGDKDSIVVVTYPDGSKDEVPVKVTVKTPSTDADNNTPVAKAQTVTPGTTPNAQDSIGNVGDLPNGTKFDFKTPVDTATEGEKDATVVVTYPDGSKDEVPVKVTVKTPSTDADKNDPTAKAQTVTPGSTPNAQDSIGNVADLPSGTTYEFKTPVDTATEGEKDATVVVTYPDGSKDEVPVKVTVKTPSTDADNNTPVAKAQTVTPGTTPNAQDSIGNVGDLPNGTKFDFKTPVDTATEGEKDATVVVTYPDGSKDEVPVKVTVKTPSTDADKNTPALKDQTVNIGETPKAQDSIGNVGDLPNGTTFDFKTPVDTITPGDKETTVVVTYPDGSIDEVPVTIKVVDPRTDADKNDPTTKAQTVTSGSTPNAQDSIGNVGDLPNGTKFEFKTPVDTTTPGDKGTTVVVTYPDGSIDEVPVTIKVVDPRTDADKNDPTAKAQTVTPGSTPNAQDSIGNVADLPSGTTYDFKTPVDTATDGEKDATVVVTYPDGSTDEVPVTIKVIDPRTDADKNTPVLKDQTVNIGETPKAQDSIGNVGDLPNGTKFDFKTPVDTTTPGDKGTTVVVTYPDGSTDEVPVTIKVIDPRTDADKNTPVLKDQTVNIGETPKAQDSIGNVGDLPNGTKFDFKTPVDTTTPGDKGTTVVVTYPDGSTDEVPVTIKVVDPRTDADKNDPTTKAQTVTPGSTPTAQDSIGNVGDLPNGTKFEFKTPVDTTTPGDKETTVVVTYPDGSTDEVPVTIKVVDPRTDADKNDPTTKAQTVTPGSTPTAQDSIGNVGDLPNGTKFEFKTPVDTTTPGDKGTTVVVTYPDGSIDEVPVTVKVVDPRTDADKNTPAPKDQTVNVGETPDAKNSIGNVGDLPNGTKFEFKTPVDTTTPGDKGTTVVVTYPDGSIDEVPVTVKVVDPRTDADKNTPTSTTPAPKAALAPMMHKQTPASSAAPANPEMSSVSTATKKQALPETGENTSLVATLFGGLMTIAGLGLAGKRKKED